MFTGIVRERAPASSRSPTAAWSSSRRSRPQIGDSINVDGICLTVVEAQNGHLAFDVMAETTDADEAASATRSTSSRRSRQASRSAGTTSRATWTGSAGCASSKASGSTVEAPPEILRYCVEKGSIAVDGVSLTIAALDDETFTVALVPHTLKVTTLGSLRPGDAVNLEVDILAKYVEKLTGAGR